MKTLLVVMFAMCMINGSLHGRDKKNKTPDFDTVRSNIGGKGIELTFVFEKGKEHNHPTFAIWLENLKGEYIQTLFVTRYVATGVFGHAPVNDSMWGNEPGEAYRPAALPYWNHKRTEQPEIEKVMPTKENPVPDAYTGATPSGSFVLWTKTDSQTPSKVKVMMEINQTWDWNEYWTNDKFLEDKHYKTSSQPSLVYYVEINLADPKKEYWLNPIGHGHYSGKNGKLFTDLSTMTTALNIVKSIKVIVKNHE